MAEGQRSAGILPYPSIEEYRLQTDPQEGERDPTPPREDPETPPIQRPDETERENQETPPLEPQQLVSVILVHRLTFSLGYISIEKQYKYSF